MKFRLNGQNVDVAAHPMKRLLDVLREECGLMGTKEGCGEGECGACTVLIGGEPVNSCLIPFAQIRAARVITIEGLKGAHPLQKAFIDEGGAQCGICTPGMILAAAVLGPHPSMEEMRVGLAGNLCRCTGYEGIYRAIRKANQKRRKSRRRGAPHPHPLPRGEGTRQRRAADKRPPLPLGEGRGEGKETTEDAT